MPTTRCSAELIRRLTRNKIDPHLAEMIIDRMPLAAQEESAKAFVTGQKKNEAAGQLLQALDRLEKGNEKTLAQDFAAVEINLNAMGIDAHDLIFYDPVTGQPRGWLKRWKNPIDTLYSAVAERIAGHADAYQNHFLQSRGFTSLAEWTRTATPDDAREVVKQLYAAAKDYKNAKPTNQQARNILDMHLENVRVMVQLGVNPAVYRGAILPSLPMSVSRLAGMEYTQFKRVVEDAVGDQTDIFTRIFHAGYVKDKTPEGIAAAKEKWMREAHIYHATGQSSRSHNPSAFYALSPDSYEKWEKLAAEFSDENQLAGRIINDFSNRTTNLSVHAAGAEVLGSGYAGRSREIVTRIGGEGRGAFIKENVRVARLYEALGGSDRSSGLYNPSLGKAIDSNEKLLRAIDSGDETAIAKANNEIVDEHINNLLAKSSRRASAATRAATQLLRPVTLALTAILLPTDSALRGATIGNRQGSVFRAMSDTVHSVAAFGNRYVKDIQNALGADLQISQEHFERFRLASRTAMHVAQEQATRFSDDVYMNATWNRVTKGVGDLMSYNAANQASVIAARVRIDDHARKFAVAGKRFNTLAQSEDVNDRLFFAEYLGPQVEADSWNKFVDVGGDMERLQQADLKAYLNMEASLLYRAKFLSGEQTTLQRQGRLPQEWRGTGRGEAANVALMFTSYVINMTEAGGKRLYTLNRIANQAKGNNTDRINGVAAMSFAEAASVMLVVGAATIYLRDYAMKGRELDTDDQTEVTKFIGKSIAYSNALGLIGDFVRAGLEAVGNYDAEEKFWARAVSDRVPGVNLFGGLVGDIVGVGAGGVEALFKGRMTKENREETMRDLRSITRLVVPFNRHLLTTPILNAITSDAEKRTLPWSFITDQPR